MGKIISALIGAAILAGLYYAGLGLLHRKMSIEIKNAQTAAVGVLMLAGWCVTAMQDWLYLNLELYALSYLLVLAMSLLCVTDLARQLIPNAIIKYMLLAWCAVAALGILADQEQGIRIAVSGVVAALFGGIVFLLCYLISRKQVGAGDVKLVFVMGLYLTGERIIGAILYGVVLCCIYCVIQLLRKKIGLKDGVPMTPFLYLGTLVALAML